MCRKRKEEAASPIGDSIKSGIMEAVQKLTNALADANGVS